MITRKQYDIARLALIHNSWFPNHPTQLLIETGSEENRESIHAVR